LGKNKLKQISDVSMPLKFTLYNKCAFALLIWCACTFVWQAYLIIITTPVSAISFSSLLLLFLLPVIAGKCILSIRAIRLYKKAALQRPAEVWFFIGAFCINVLFACVTIWLSTAIFLPGSIFNTEHNTGWLYVWRLLLNISVLVAGLLSSYLALFDLPLWDKIPAMHEEALLTFEIEERSSIP